MKQFAIPSNATALANQGKVNKLPNARAKQSRLVNRRAIHLLRHHKLANAAHCISIHMSYLLKSLTYIKQSRFELTCVRLRTEAITTKSAQSTSLN